MADGHWVVDFQVTIPVFGATTKDIAEEAAYAYLASVFRVAVSDEREIGIELQDTTEFIPDEE